MQQARSIPTLLCLAIQLFVIGAARASAPDPIGHALGLGRQITPAEMQTGGLLIRGSDGLRAAPILETQVEIEITGLIGRTHVSQRFRNPTSDWVEAVYVFPLPEKAAVDRLKMRIGERIIEGQIQERAKARATYEKAKSEGRKASLVEQERPNLFTTAVANIGPGEEVEITLTYQGEVRYDTGRFSLRFPMVVAPRYIPGTSTVTGFSGTGWANNTDMVPDAERITPPISDPDDRHSQSVSIRVRIDAGFRLVDIESATHPVRVRAGRDQVYELELADGSVPADSDFVLTWRPVVGQTPEAALFYEEWKGEHYALLMILPPDPATAPTQSVRLSKEVIFVIDTSGSMGGESIVQARRALIDALGRLRPEDAFNVIRFDSTFERLHPEARPATAQALREAIDWVAKLESRGGTEMLPALEAALVEGPERRAIRQVIFITDGAVGNEAGLFAAIKQDLASSRLFTVGIGSAPNSHFMTKAAEFGRGTFTYIASPEEVEARMGELFTKLDSPVLHDLTARWDTSGVEMWPRQIPDVYLGEPVVIAARLPASTGKVSLVGKRGREDIEIELDVRGGLSHEGVGRLWARRKIASLMNSLHDGAEIEQVTVEVTTLGVVHHLVTRWTSLVAVDVTPTAPVDVDLVTQAVPTLLPRGWSLRKLLGMGPSGARVRAPQPDPGSGGQRDRGSPLQANAPVVTTQALAFMPPGQLPQGATPAMLLLSIGSAMLGASGLIWQFASARRPGPKE